MGVDSFVGMKENITTEATKNEIITKLQEMDITFIKACCKDGRRERRKRGKMTMGYCSIFFDDKDIT